MLFCQCSLGPSANEKAEAGQLSRAIDVLRDASNAQKGELLEALKRVPCAASDLCELKRQCAEGYGRHVAALSQTAHAKELLASEGGDVETARILDRALHELETAAPKIAACADLQGAAHRKYKF